MGWKPITGPLFVQFQQCIDAELTPILGADSATHTLVLAGISDCFQSTFVEPVDPPDPPDPPAGTCLDGFLAGAGYWDGYCIDEPPKFRSESNNTVGVMGTNANAYKRMASSPQARGKVAVEVFYRTAEIPQDGGGGHLFTAQSGERALNPNYRKGWFRPDIISSQSFWKVHTYNLNGNGERWYIRNGQVDAVVDIWNTNIAHQGVGRWIAISLEWDRRDIDKMWMKFTADGRSAERTVTISPQTVNPYSIACGNMDNLGDFGGTPEIAFRNLVWS